MQVLEVKSDWLAGMWLGPRLWFAIAALFCSSAIGESYMKSLPHPLFLKKLFFLIIRLVHIYIIIKIQNKHKI